VCVCVCVYVCQRIPLLLDCTHPYTFPCRLLKVLQTILSITAGKNGVLPYSYSILDNDCDDLKMITNKNSANTNKETNKNIFVSSPSQPKQTTEGKQVRKTRKEQFAYDCLPYTKLSKHGHSERVKYPHSQVCLHYKR
jgi:hypothetical protein